MTIRQDSLYMFLKILVPVTKITPKIIIKNGKINANITMMIKILNPKNPKIKVSNFKNY